MSLREGVRGTGLMFLGSVLGMIALLVIGLGIASWFTAGQTALGSSGEGSFGRATMSVGLVSIDVCTAGECVSAPTYELADGDFRAGALATLIIGAAFGLAVLWFAHRRIADVEVPVLVKGVGYALGFAALTCAALTMFAYPPGAMMYEVTSRTGGLLWSGVEADRTMLASLGRQHWAGNVRELRNLVEGAIAMGPVPLPGAVRPRDRKSVV